MDYSIYKRKRKIETKDKEGGVVRIMIKMGTITIILISLFGLILFIIGCLIWWMVKGDCDKEEQYDEIHGDGYKRGM